MRPACGGDVHLESTWRLCCVGRTAIGRKSCRQRKRIRLRSRYPGQNASGARQSGNCSPANASFFSTISWSSNTYDAKPIFYCVFYCTNKQLSCSFFKI